MATNSDKQTLAHGEPESATCPIQLALDGEMSDYAAFGNLWYMQRRAQKVTVYLQLFHTFGQWSIEQATAYELLLLSVKELAKENWAKEVTVFRMSEAIGVKYEGEAVDVVTNLASFCKQLKALVTNTTDESFQKLSEKYKERTTGDALTYGKIMSDLSKFLTCQANYSISYYLTCLQESLNAEKYRELAEEFMSTLEVTVYVDGQVAKEEAKRIYEVMIHGLGCKPLGKHKVYAAEIVDTGVYAMKFKVESNTMRRTCIRIDVLNNDDPDILAHNLVLSEYLVRQAPTVYLSYQWWTPDNGIQRPIGLVTCIREVDETADFEGLALCNLIMQTSLMAAMIFDGSEDELAASKKKIISGLQATSQINWNWDAIVSGHTGFDYKLKTIECVNNVTRRSLLKYFHVCYLDRNEQITFIISFDPVHGDSTSSEPVKHVVDPEWDVFNEVKNNWFEFCTKFQDDNGQDLIVPNQPVDVQVVEHDLLNFRSIILKDQSND